MIAAFATSIPVMVTIGTIMCMTVVDKGWLNGNITIVFSRITPNILTGLSVQYVIDDMSIIGLITT